MSAPQFATVILDVDSTVSGIEGIDWLAARRGESIARDVVALTDKAMQGEIALEQVYGARLGLVRPHREDIDALSRAYVEAIAPGCAAAIRRMRDAGIDVKLISGGLRPALLALAEHLDLSELDLYAVDVSFDGGGSYSSFETASPLSTALGKRTLVESLPLRRPVLAVGDGSTDLAMRPVVDKFVAFTGFVRRDLVAEQADAVVNSFGELAQFVFGS